LSSASHQVGKALIVEGWRIKIFPVTSSETTYRNVSDCGQSICDFKVYSRVDVALRPAIASGDVRMAALLDLPPKWSLSISPTRYLCRKRTCKAFGQRTGGAKSEVPINQDLGEKP
jgi:hypothetical protein